MEQFVSLFAEKNLSTFLILTVIIGGGCGYISGRALAITWRPQWQYVFYMLLLGCVIRFFHFALFGETLLSLYYYATTTAVLIACSASGYIISRRIQMKTHYYWLYK